MMKNAFCFTLKALFVLKIFIFFVLTFWPCTKNSLIREVNFKTYDVTTRLTNNYNTHFTQYFAKQNQPDNEIWSFNRTAREIFFLKNQAENETGRLISDLLLLFKKA